MCMEGREKCEIETWVMGSSRENLNEAEIRPSVLRCGRGVGKLSVLSEFFFCTFWVPQSPIGLISAEIGARCRIPGHASDHRLTIAQSQ